MWAHDVQHATHAHEPVEHAGIHELRKVVGRSLRLGRLQLRTRRPAPLQRCGCTYGVAAWHLRMLTAAGDARQGAGCELLVACALADSASRPPSLRVRGRSVRARWRVSTTPRVSIACCAGCAKSGSRAHSASPNQNEAGACTRPSAAALHLLCTNPAARHVLPKHTKLNDGASHRIASLHGTRAYAHAHALAYPRACAAASKPDVELADEELADVELVSALTSTRSSSVASPASVLRHQ